VDAGIAGKISGGLKTATQFRVELHEGAGNTETSRIGLPGVTAAVAKDKNVKFIRRFGSKQRLANHRT
jgi:hypothetical protein